MEEQKFKEQFFSEIYDQNIEKIYRFVFFKVNSEVLAQDITSDTFSRLWAQILNNKDIKNPTAFLYKVARNLIIDHYRQNQRASISLESLDFCPQDESQNVEEAVMTKFDAEKVKAKLTSLNDIDRQALTLYYIEQEPITNVAKSLGKSEGATRVLIHRSIKKLRKHLES
jgi:RNA polymerase sigma-70 factor (ECF subfamily)